MAKPIASMRKKGEIGAEDDIDSAIIDLARVTRVMAGGKRMRFRAAVAVGDHKGRVGLGIAKGADVTIAVNKATIAAKKNMIVCALVNETIPHEVFIKFNAAKVLLKPAKHGTGVKAGGVVRVMCDLAGINNIVSKILGTNNKINNAKAVLKGLASLKKRPLKAESHGSILEKTKEAPEKKEAEIRDMAKGEDTKKDSDFIDKNF